MKSTYLTETFFSTTVLRLDFTAITVQLTHGGACASHGNPDETCDLVESVFGIHDPIGLSYLTQIRVGLSKLKFHKFRHNFRDTIDPLCPTNDGIEDTEHFLLLCPSFDIQRRDLLAGVSELLRPYVRINSLPNNALIQILLFRWTLPFYWSGGVQVDVAAECGRDFYLSFL